MRCQLLLHTIDQAKRVCDFWDFSEKQNSKTIKHFNGCYLPANCPLDLVTVKTNILNESSNQVGLSLI